ncbi:acyl-[acyl-carrier-protein] thioesterase [Butyrivibrio sp. WCD3002]|uniref:acyl-[acyl-carrier-protein] thioesterase n=1 Tax=Butyrivibrio sp. WCD3002 TaxID=1280676 RepID=UPI000421F8D5|nr:acyl-ACP thioesterase domain-containing protein [Butyrivibrio sp. WCD3002]
MYSFDSRIRYSECDINGFLTIEGLIDYFQDCSTFQTQEGPATMEAMEKLGIAWVINSWQVNVKRLPKLGENVTIGTVPYELKAFLGLRNFFMKTAEGEELAVANSVWSLLNLEKGTPYRINDDIIKTYPLDEKLPMDYASRKIAEPRDGRRFSVKERKVGLHHLDTNHHVNNGQYIRIALAAIEEFSDKEKADALRALAKNRKNFMVRAEYRQQAHLGDIIHPEIVMAGDDTDTDGCVVLLKDDEGKPYSIVELKQL